MPFAEFTQTLERAISGLGSSGQRLLNAGLESQRRRRRF